MLHKLRALRNQIGGWRLLRKEKRFALSTQTRGHYSVRPVKETVFSSLNLIGSKKGREDSGLVRRDAEDCKSRTPARHLLEVDHSLLGDPQAAEVVALCLNG